jgi:uncharacterized protein
LQVRGYVPLARASGIRACFDVEVYEEPGVTSSRAFDVRIASASATDHWQPDSPGVGSTKARGRRSAMHPNEQVLRDLDAAQMEGDVEAFSGYFTDDVIIHVPGKSSFAGVHKGKDQFLELFGRFMERTPEYTFEPHAYLADDEHGVTLQHSHYKRGNETLDDDDTFVCHFRDGKVSEMWFLSQDQEAVDRFLG